MEKKNFIKKSYDTVPTHLKEMLLCNPTIRIYTPHFLFFPLRILLLKGVYYIPPPTPSHNLKKANYGVPLAALYC
jgi:hypothetical protein